MEKTRGLSTPDSSSMHSQTTLKIQTAVKSIKKVQPQVGLEKHDHPKWGTRDIFPMVVIGCIHLLCLFAPFTFSWSAFGVACFLFILTGVLGTNLSYHRNLSHKSFKLPRYLEYLFAYFGLHALHGDPINWVSIHRYHHKFTDTARDPHSPLEGFWFSHVLWIFDGSKALQKDVMSRNNVGDLMRQPYYRFLERTMVFHISLLAILLYMLGGFPFIVWGMGVRSFCAHHTVFCSEFSLSYLGIPDMEDWGFIQKQLGCRYIGIWRGVAQQPSRF